MTRNSRTKNSLLNIVTNGIQQVWNILLRFIVRTVFIYILGAEYLGINGLFTSLLTVLSLTELGLDSAMNYRLYKPLAEGDDKQVRKLMKFYRLAYRVIGGIIFILGIALIPLLPYMISDYSRLDTLGINAALIFVLYLTQSVTSYLFFAYCSTVVKADQKMYLLNNASLVIDTVSGVAQIAVLLLTHDFVIYTIVLVVFSIITNLVYAIIAKKQYPQFFTPEEDSLSKEEILELFKDCGALFIFKVDSAVMNAAGNIILSIFSGLAVVGIYSNYLIIYLSSKGIFQRLYASVKASVGNVFAVEEEAKQYLIFEVMNMITVLLYGTTGILIACVANEFIEIWIGTDYVLAQPFSILMGIELLLSGLKLNLNQIRNASGVFRQMWWRPLIGIVINLGVSLALVQYLGPSAVVLGIICAALFANLAVDPSLIHKYSFNGYKPVSYYYKKNLLFILLLFIVGSANFALCSWINVGVPIINLAVHILICLASTPVVFMLVYRNKPEMKYLIDKGVSLKKKVLKR